MKAPLISEIIPAIKPLIGKGEIILEHFLTH